MIAARILPEETVRQIKEPWFLIAPNFFLGMFDEPLDPRVARICIENHAP